MAIVMHKNQSQKSKLESYITCKDYLVSGETFELVYDADYEMLLTKPVPKNINSYYESKRYISHTDQNKSLFDRAYQLVKKISLKRKLKLLNSFHTSQKKVLDVGAGTGDFLKTCAENGWDIYGIEPNNQARDLAQKKGVHLVQKISMLKESSFDVITLWHVLEHIEELPQFIQTLKNLLKKDGMLVIAVPNFKSYDARFYKHYWAAYDVPRHLWHFSKTSIKKLFSKANLTVQKVLPMKFDAFYVSLLSEKYKSGKMKPFSAFYRGWMSNFKANRSGEYSSLIYLLKNENKDV